jgi:hypothetical protein
MLETLVILLPFAVEFRGENRSAKVTLILVQTPRLLLVPPLHPVFLTAASYHYSTTTICNPMERDSHLAAPAVGRTICHLTMVVRRGFRLRWLTSRGTLDSS